MKDDLQDIYQKKISLLANNFNKIMDVFDYLCDINHLFIHDLFTVTNL